MAQNKIEQYLIDMMLTYQQIGQNMWMLDDEERGLQGVAVHFAEPLVVIRAEVMDTPKGNPLELYTRLLELNASDVIHGAYALENGKIILVNILEYDTMDYSEFRAALDSFSLALTQHYPILSKFREKPAESAGAAGKA
jgi:hypothetical protein